MTEQEDRELKNAIFAAKQAAENAGAGPTGMVSQTQHAADVWNTQLPTGIAPLPSNGLIYPADHPCSGKEELEILGMTVGSEDILTNRVFIKKGSVITKLIESCLLDKTIDVNSLISGDRNTLMIAIRITGYGNEYNLSMNCPSCDTRQEITVDLNTLNIRHLKISPVAPGANQFEFTLPMSKRKVVFKFLTGSEEEEIIAEMEAKKKKGIQEDKMISSRLFRSIVSVDGISNKVQLGQFIKIMSAGDSLKLRKYIDTNEPGIEMKVDFTCKSCDHFEVLGLPLSAEFFWPNA